MPIPIDAELNRTAPRRQAGKLTPADRRAGPTHRRAGVLAKAPEDPPAVDAAPADPHPASEKNASNTSHRGRTLSIPARITRARSRVNGAVRAPRRRARRGVSGPRWAAASGRASLAEAPGFVMTSSRPGCSLCQTGLPDSREAALSPPPDPTGILPFDREGAGVESLTGRGDDRGRG